MKNLTNRHVTTRFGPEVQFEVVTITAAEYRQRTCDQFAQLENRLVEQRLHQGNNDLLRPELEEVANEAAALSWTTPYPNLVMPLLFEEMARTEQSRVFRQQQIREESRALVEEALA